MDSQLPPAAFSYADFTTRNIGFVSEAEQQRLLAGRVLVIGVGGMGGAAVQALARAGVGGFGIADIDTFEVSNLNRQVFADLDSINQDKAAETAKRLRRINPGWHSKSLVRTGENSSTRCCPGTRS
jgi:molybdopterin/thiamine biosynthesis adenylyltransferase